MSGTTKDGGLASERRVTLGLASSGVTRGEETNLTFDSLHDNVILDFFATLCQFLLLKLCKNKNSSLG